MIYKQVGVASQVYMFTFHVSPDLPDTGKGADLWPSGQPPGEAASSVWPDGRDHLQGVYTTGVNMDKYSL